MGSSDFKEQFDRSPEHVNELLHCVNDPLFVKDEGHRYVFVNKACCVFFGRSEQEILGKMDEDFFPPDQVRVFWVIDKGVLESGLPSENEETVLCPATGKNLIVVTKKTLFRDSLGKRYVVGIVRDVTEIRNAQKKAKEGEDCFRGILEQVQQIALMLDDSGKVTFCNDFFLHVTGYERQEVLGQDWFEKFLPEDCRVEVQAFFFEAIKARIFPPCHENEILTKSGQRRLILWSNVLILQGGSQPNGCASLGEDVTDRHQQDKELGEKIKEIGLLNKFMMGREMRIIELKREVDEALKKGGFEGRYKIL